MNFILETENQFHYRLDSLLLMDNVWIVVKLRRASKPWPLQSFKQPYCNLKKITAALYWLGPKDLTKLSYARFMAVGTILYLSDTSLNKQSCLFNPLNHGFLLFEVDDLVLNRSQDQHGHCLSVEYGSTALWAKSEERRRENRRKARKVVETVGMGWRNAGKLTLGDLIPQPLGSRHFVLPSRRWTGGSSAGSRRC